MNKINPTILQGSNEKTMTPNGNPFVGMEPPQGMELPQDADAEERRAAEGLTGEMLDALLINRHVEGQRLGRSQALAETRGQFAKIWDNAYSEGHRAGAEGANRAIVPIVATPISHAIAAILAAKGKSGSQAVKLECEAAAAQLAQLYQQVTGQLPEGYATPINIVGDVG